MIALFITLYLIGMFIYCLLNHKRIGTKELDIIGYPEEVESDKIVMESFIWPAILLAFIFWFWPVSLLSKLLNNYHKSHK